MIDITTMIGWILSALIGGAGLVGLIMIKPKHDIEKIIEAIQKEQTVQCYCILACLKGLAEQGCDGPVHEGIDLMEKHLNKQAHGQ